MFYNFYRNIEIQISTFSRPKMRFKLLLKIMTFSEHFSIFLNFHDRISKIFSKEQIRCYKEFFYLLFL